MRRLSISVVILLCGSLAYPSSSPAKPDHKLSLRPTPAPIEIDGRIDPQWAAADSTVLDFQLLPYYGQRPTVRTTAKVLTSAALAVVVPRRPEGD